MHSFHETNQFIHEAICRGERAARGHRRDAIEHYIAAAAFHDAATAAYEASDDAVGDSLTADANAASVKGDAEMAAAQADDKRIVRQRKVLKVQSALRGVK